ncbi:phage shock protein PspA [Hirschia baltica]|uniref:Phage shock protein A, PspA n=1 Tax=Hirschia baltica (strain ATCC 49814 / DSM 5838 / IFAM 1418) TaxID=582402 RepID=C6XR65_HIRBI|nr:phage shock protein PspA [Hirschia baltica]ACT60596.1 phage shock protein A, PspA [Hirschia baltica ATCC 49814]
MGIFSRFGDIINSNLNAMLDKAEDPEKIARLIIQEMEDTLVEVRTAAARTMADKKELQREMRELQIVRDDWSAKAELAIEKDREDLARGALSAKQRAEREIESRKSALAAVDDAAAKRQDDLGKLQAKLEEAKTKHRALMVRRQAAEERIKVRSRIDDSKVDDALHRYAAVERKVDELEAYADTYDLKSKTLESEFADLEASESVELELAAMKARKKSGSDN